MLKMSKMEKVKMRLRAVKEISISYSQFVQICCSVDGDVDGTVIAKDLDQSGAVLVIGDVVFLNPELVILRSLIRKKKIFRYVFVSLNLSFSFLIFYV